MFTAGENISLRAIEPEDVERLYLWENNQGIWHLSRNVTPFSRFDIEQYVLNAGKDIFADKQLRLMIDAKKKAETVGAVDLFQFDPLNRRVGIGILILEQFREKGFASEALDLAIGYCFNKLMVHQVFANIGADNTGSIRLFEKKGFKMSGRKKDWQLVENNWHDELFYQLINPKY